PESPFWVSRHVPCPGGSCSAFPELLEVVDVETLESLADVEEKHAENQRADEDVEQYSELYHHRHAIGRGRGSEEETVLHGEKADHLRHRLAPRDHHEEREQDACRGDSQRALGDRAGELRDRSCEIEGEYDEHDADQHLHRYVDDRLYVPL